MNPDVYFHEEQSFRRGIAWAILLFTSLAFVGILLVGIAEVFDPAAPWLPQIMANQVSVVLGIILILGYIVLIFVFMRLRLQVEVNSAGLFLRFVPFHRKLRQIDLRGIDTVSAVTYRPVRDYGGYGIRFTRNGKAFNVRGTAGVRLDYENGYHILIGSQQADAFCAALRHLIEVNPPGPMEDEEEWDEDFEDEDEAETEDTDTERTG
ncbi:MAG: hypothetical protein IT368_04485 [Candidatus Hydrogenedentes bacterium]|nr:hypothetical protein [Candidatus Hydrogenedentota bacterium]